MTFASAILNIYSETFLYFISLTLLSEQPNKYSKLKQRKYVSYGKLTMKTLKRNHFKSQSITVNKQFKFHKENTFTKCSIF